MPEANYPPGITTETFDEKLWNKDKVGAWRRDHGEVDYGIYWMIYDLEPSNGLFVLTIHIGASYMEIIITTRHYSITLTKSANYGKYRLKMKKQASYSLHFFLKLLNMGRDSSMKGSTK